MIQTRLGIATILALTTALAVLVPTLAAETAQTVVTVEGMH